MKKFIYAITVFIFAVISVQTAAAKDWHSKNVYASTTTDGVTIENKNDYPMSVSFGVDGYRKPDNKKGYAFI